MDGGTMNDHVTGSAEESSLQSFFGRLNYNYGGRYLLEMNVRHDGSSRMPNLPQLPRNFNEWRNFTFSINFSFVMIHAPENEGKVA